jgi:tetratricopeptide (TPR) repeat protein
MVGTLSEAWGREVVPVQLPIGSEAGFSGVVDLVHRKAWSFEAGGKGKGKAIDVPEEMAEAVEEHRNTLIEAVAESDDMLMERFFEAGTLDEKELADGLRKAVAARLVFPVTASAAASGVGVSALLDSAVDAADRLGYRKKQRDLLDRLADLEIDPETNPALVGRVYLLHARYGVSTGQYGLARGWLRNAVEMFERAGMEQERSESLRRLSLVQSHVGELKEARELVKESLERAQTDAQRALARLSLGAIEVLEDRFEAALKQSDRVLAILRDSESGNRPGILAAAHLLRARIYRVMGAPGRAHASASRALRLARVAGERRLEAEAGARLGGILLDLDRAAEAESTLREAVRLAVEIEDRRGEAIASLFLGILLWEGAVPEAGAVLARAVDLAEQMGLNRVEAVTRSILSRIAREGGRLEEAFEASGRSMQLLETFGAELSDRIVIAGTHALVLSTRGRTKEAQALERKLRE